MHPLSPEPDLAPNRPNSPMGRTKVCSACGDLGPRCTGQAALRPGGRPSTVPSWRIRYWPRGIMDQDAGPAAAPFADQAGYLISVAARAPSVHNTQPWRFRVTGSGVELYADPARRLQTDSAGREMLISCGAALYGLRLAIRSLGWDPVTELLPDPARARLLARAGPGSPAPVTARERRLLEAVPHRHTHRGEFTPDPLSPGLVAGLQHDALAEGAALVIVRPGLPLQRLSAITIAAARRLDLDPHARADIRRWTRALTVPARDGIPAHAFPGRPGTIPGQLRQ